jgi:leucyl aminopeptidase
LKYENDKLNKIIQTIGEDIGELVIGLPCWTAYKKFTLSSVADYKNVDTRNCKSPDGFMASMFLYNFVPDKLKNKWVHFDISNSFTNGYSNGNACLLLLQFIITLCNINE